MRSRLLSIWDRFRTSFWFEPTLLSLLALALAVGTTKLDADMDSRLSNSPWVSTSTSAATSMLSSLASTAFTLAGVSFSITMVTLSMASAQFGSRQLRSVISNSIADRVMGAFIATALYCMVVLRFVRDAAESKSPFVPQISTGVATIMGLLCLALLIWFVHEVSVNIQAPTVIAQIAAELDASIDRLYPEKTADTAGETHSPPDVDSFSRRVMVPGSASGYIDGFDRDDLVSAAKKHDSVIFMKLRPGKFVVPEVAVACVAANHNRIDDETDELVKTIQSLMVVGKWRSPRQDISCSVYDLVDIASRALSPGVNDPFTAMACIDRLGAAIGRIAGRPELPTCFSDEDGNPRLVIAPVTVPQLLDDAFRMIRQYGKTSPSISIRLIEGLKMVAAQTTRQEDAHAVSRHANAIRADFFSTDPNEDDLADFNSRFDRLPQFANTKTTKT